MEIFHLISSALSTRTRIRTSYYSTVLTSDNISISVSFDDSSIELIESLLSRDAIDPKCSKDVSLNCSSLLRSLDA